MDRTVSGSKWTSGNLWSLDEMKQELENIVKLAMESEKSDSTTGSTQGWELKVAQSMENVKQQLIGLSDANDKVKTEIAKRQALKRVSEVEREHLCAELMAVQKLTGQYKDAINSQQNPLAGLVAGVNSRESALLAKKDELRARVAAKQNQLADMKEARALKIRAEREEVNEKIKSIQRESRNEISLKKSFATARRLEMENQKREMAQKVEELKHFILHFKDHVRVEDFPEVKQLADLEMEKFHKLKDENRAKAIKIRSVKAKITKMKAQHSRTMKELNDESAALKRKNPTRY